MATVECRPQTADRNPHSPVTLFDQINKPVHRHFVPPPSFLAPLAPSLPLFIPSSLPPPHYFHLAYKPLLRRPGFARAWNLFSSGPGLDRLFRHQAAASKEIAFQPQSPRSLALLVFERCRRLPPSKRGSPQRVSPLSISPHNVRGRAQDQQPQFVNIDEIHSPPLPPRLSNSTRVY